MSIIIGPLRSSSSNAVAVALWIKGARVTPGGGPNMAAAAATGERDGERAGVTEVVSVEVAGVRLAVELDEKEEEEEEEEEGRDDVLHSLDSIGGGGRLLSFGGSHSLPSLLAPPPPPSWERIP